MSCNRFLLGLLAIAAAAACGSDRETISLDDYNRACAVDADCVLVAVGYMCPCRACPNAAIASRDLSKYEEDFKEIDCGDVSDVQCGPCPSPPQVWCNSGTCEVRNLDAGSPDAD